jgi:hypothetical protein
MPEENMKNHRLWQFLILTPMGAPPLPAPLLHKHVEEREICELFKK